MINNRYKISLTLILLEVVMDLKQLRKNKKITQFRLASVIGVNQSAVAMWERGASIPQTKDLTKIAKALGVTVDELLACFEK